MIGHARSPAWRAREWVRDLSLARKVIAVIMGVTSAALVLACLALVAFDTTNARAGLTRDIGILADVVGAHSTAAVSFGDAKGATEILDGVALNENVRVGRSSATAPSWRDSIDNRTPCRRRS